MVKKVYPIVWTKRTESQLQALFKYISEDSPANAIKVVNDILTAVNKAAANPEFYGPDKFKTDNDGSYRSFEKHHYRIAYRFEGDVVRILRVRHTKMEPKDY